MMRHRQHKKGATNSTGWGSGVARGACRRRRERFYTGYNVPFAVGIVRMRMTRYDLEASLAGAGRKATARGQAEDPTAEVQLGGRADYRPHRKEISGFGADPNGPAALAWDQADLPAFWNTEDLYCRSDWKQRITTAPESALPI